MLYGVGHSFSHCHWRYLPSVISRHPNIDLETITGVFSAYQAAKPQSASNLKSGRRRNDVFQVSGKLLSCSEVKGTSGSD